MGAKPLFCPPNNQTRIFKFCLYKKINMKESRNRYNNTKKTEYILNERCQFCKKKLSMTKKNVFRNFGENRRELFQDFLSEKKFPQNFCPQYLLQVCAGAPSRVWGSAPETDAILNILSQDGIHFGILLISHF